MHTLILVEHDHKTVKSSTLATVTAAKQFNLPITLLVAGYQCSEAAQKAAQITGVDRVLVADNVCYEHFLAENMAALIVEHACDYEYILAPATTFAKNILPRVAALLDVAQISDIIAIENNTTFLRPIYAGNAIAKVQSHDKQKVITVRPTAFDNAQTHNTSAPVQSLTTAIDLQLSQFVRQEKSVSTRPELSSASIVISGGRGLQSGENFKMLEALADRLGAAIGASRAAVDAGFVPNDYQVGQTGKVVAPNLYIAIGISGAIQHLAGMKDSKVIVAINKDGDAPIFQIADYGLVGDLFQIVPELIEALDKLGHQ